MDWRSIVAAFLELLGAVAVVAGLWVVSPPVALIVAGVLLVVAGFTLDRTGGRS